MYCFKAGFFMVEILISITMITLFVVICMRHQAQSIALQTQAIEMMRVVDHVETVCNTVKISRRAQNIADSVYRYSFIVNSVTTPCVRGAPVQFSFSSVARMKVMTVTASWQGPSGLELCQLPVVFKESVDGGS